ncbi:putative dehydrogenase [Microbacterium trichothecenolyticum]|uniref:Gfo/Idh/MocA family protein n=1 Tax=Microbacterium trichothecenolyticum TaxID=69370 RepID=UPI002863A01C|nr:Gfo/Idh/MocA family oxidoreductase [Microbacterium trichothecenolyticum]MDR7110739.1 putative dehydrogenase [Microbacterium trichothecenolyticum]
MTGPTRYALIGTGARAQMYLEALAGPYADQARLVAWADPNPGRLDWNEHRLVRAGQAAPERFDVDDLGAMIGRKAIDRVIVTAPDYAHADLVVAALEGGADAIVEKPLTTDAEGVRRIADAAERTGRSVTVTFNYRYAPRNTALKRIISAGELGDITSVHFEWLLDTSHGADYFRRWHRRKENSGGLLVHKSSHHFDLVNWWLGDQPERVFATGGLRFYGADNAARRGLGPRPARGTVDVVERDPFLLDLREHDVLRGLYYEQEQHDGYLRDRDVFGDDITIEDNLSLVVDYAHGSSMTYALNAHSPWEGYTVSVNGTRGRAELAVVERGAILLDESGRQQVVDPSARPEDVADDSGRPVGERLVVQHHFGAAREIPIPHVAGGHGGADTALLHDLFDGAGDDPLEHAASWLDGVRAMAVGVAGNTSLATGMPVRTRDLPFGLAADALRPAARALTAAS